MLSTEIQCKTPEATMELGRRLGRSLKSGDVVLLTGGLGAGKTLLTKGIIDSLGFDLDEVTSPSFALVNHYKTTNLDVFHIDLWRLEGSGEDVAEAVGLWELLENDNAVMIIEWAEHLHDLSFPGNHIKVKIAGDGDDPRTISFTPNFAN